VNALLVKFGLASPAPTLTAIESGGSTVFNRDTDGKLYAGTAPILYQGRQITFTQFAGYTPVAVEDLGASGKQVLFRTSTNNYFVWTTDASWNYSSGTTVLSSNASAVNALLVKFGLASPAPTLTAIESGGSTVLNRDTDGKLYAGTAPILYQGRQITFTQFAGYTPIAAEDRGVTGKVVVFKHTSGDYFAWTMTSSWAFESGSWSRLTAISNVNALLESVGAPTYVEAAGATALRQDSNGKLFAGEAPILYQGSQITASQFAGFTPVAVEELNGTSRKMVFQYTNGNYFIWTLSSGWAYASGEWIASSDAAAVTSLRQTYGF
jgi:hypothetical protein